MMNNALLVRETYQGRFAEKVLALPSPSYKRAFPSRNRRPFDEMPVYVRGRLNMLRMSKPFTYLEGIGFMQHHESFYTEYLIFLNDDEVKEIANLLKEKA